MDVKTYENVIHYIKSEILSGGLIKGQKLLPERELAQKIGVSRTSVREALRTMEILGVIESFQGAGNYITGNIEKSITETLSMMFLLQQTNSKQLSEFREALELKAVELAIENITEEQVFELEAIFSDMSNALDEESAAKLDKNFHFAIAKASCNAILIQILNAISVLIDSFINDIRRNILQIGKNKSNLLEIHQEILIGIKNRDIMAARTALQEHSSIIKENLKI